ncbi:hypothetical protein TNCV_2768491 [Trichonephila clavipes]|nr:hypothetical protein TNCV_2768491 [Trichonephila clavipes]
MKSQLQLRETGSFHVSRHDAGRRNTSREESILNIPTDRLESSTRTVTYHVNNIFPSLAAIEDMMLFRISAIYDMSFMNADLEL